MFGTDDGSLDLTDGLRRSRAADEEEESWARNEKLARFGGAP
jgi:hypothetical protein